MACRMQASCTPRWQPRGRIGRGKPNGSAGGFTRPPRSPRRRANPVKRRGWTSSRRASGFSYGPGRTGHSASCRRHFLGDQRNPRRQRPPMSALFQTRMAIVLRPGFTFPVASASISSSCRPAHQSFHGRWPAYSPLSCTLRLRRPCPSTPCSARCRRAGGIGRRTRGPLFLQEPVVGDESEGSGRPGFPLLRVHRGEEQVHCHFGPQPAHQLMVGHAGHEQIGAAAIRETAHI